MKRIFIAFLIFLPLAFILALVFGAPSAIKPLASISSPFEKVDFRDLPLPKQFKARDGKALVFRLYQTLNPKGSVVLVHGSSGSGTSVHVLAKEFAEQGYTTYALDMRGHGGSGVKGQIDYIGQLDDDVEDFMQEIKPQGVKTLIGFSSGGGFVLRFAGGKTQNLFDTYLLLAPFISPQSPTYKANAGGWVSVGVPRVIALSILNGFGITSLNHLPVVNFAVSPQYEDILTKSYSFALQSNFQPLSNYQENIKAVKKPMAIVAGESDELFNASKFKEVFPNHQVTLIPNIQHIPLTLEKNAIDVIIKVSDLLNKF